MINTSNNMPLICDGGKYKFHTISITNRTMICFWKFNFHIIIPLGYEIKQRYLAKPQSK